MSSSAPSMLSMAAPLNPSALMAAVASVAAAPSIASPSDGASPPMTACTTVSTHSIQSAASSASSPTTRAIRMGSELSPSASLGGTCVEDEVGMGEGLCTESRRKCRQAPCRHAPHGSAQAQG